MQQSLRSKNNTPVVLINFKIAAKIRKPKTYVSKINLKEEDDQNLTALSPENLHHCSDRRLVGVELRVGLEKNRGIEGGGGEEDDDETEYPREEEDGEDD